MESDIKISPLNDANGERKKRSLIFKIYRNLCALCMNAVNRFLPEPRRLSRDTSCVATALPRIHIKKLKITTSFISQWGEHI